MRIKSTRARRIPAARASRIKLHGAPYQAPESHLSPSNLTSEDLTAAPSHHHSVHRAPVTPAALATATTTPASPSTFAGGEVQRRRGRSRRQVSRRAPCPRCVVPAVGHDLLVLANMLTEALAAPPRVYRRPAQLGPVKSTTTTTGSGSERKNNSATETVADTEAESQSWTPSTFEELSAWIQSEEFATCRQFFEDVENGRYAAIGLVAAHPRA